MNAMEYETLLRRVYHCGRNYAKGADADIYRKMERAFHNLETKTLYTSHNQREYEYRSTFAAVRGNVKEALSAGVRQLQSANDIDKLNTLSKKLDIQFYDKEKLDAIIATADDIFRENGLQLG